MSFIASRAQAPRFTSTENFRRYFAGVTTIPIGPAHVIGLPADLVRRSVWVAFGSPFQDIGGAEWALYGRLCFFRAGTNVGELTLSASSDERISAVNDPLPFQMRPEGSRQPALRFPGNASTSANYVRYLDLPCFEFTVDADQAVIDITGWTVSFGTLGVNFSIMTGMRILSQAF